MDMIRTVAVVVRTQQSVSAASDAYVRSIGCIDASRALLAAPVWTVQHSMRWQARRAKDAARGTDLAG